MAAHPSIDPTDFLHEHLAQASPDLLRSLLTSMIDTLMSAEADAVCGAVHGERSAEVWAADTSGPNRLEQQVLDARQELDRWEADAGARTWLRSDGEPCSTPLTALATTSLA